MIATPLTKTVKTDPDEIQVRNLQDHQRVYDPSANDTLLEILRVLKGVEFHLETITGEKYEN